MINTIKETIKGILGIEKKIDKEDIECAIDEDVVECDGLDYEDQYYTGCLLYTSPSPRDRQKSRMPSSA